MLLEVSNIQVRFGGVVALNDLSMTVGAGEICALIGPNGAGKTTLFNVVSRLVEPSAGRIEFAGFNLLDVPTHEISARGVARTFQNLALVDGLSVVDNVAIGAFSVSRGGFVASALALPVRRSERAVRARALEVLGRLELAHLADGPCTGLPFGTLKRIEIARAIMCQPQLLLLDEPAAGLTHGEVGELGELIRALRAELDLTVLLVEHHMGMVMELADSVVVMQHGERIASGTPAEVRTNERVIEAYLGASS